MAGRFIAVVGPSGVGKDSVMEALARADARLQLVRRVITRPNSFGGEDFEGVTEEEFAERGAAGAFALSWSAHGLRYGIPRNTLKASSQGKDLLVNLSRNKLAEAAAVFPNLLVLSLSAAPEILAERLASRGRESQEDIERRLARDVLAPPQGVPILYLDNSGPLDDTVAIALSHLFALPPVQAS